MKNKIYDGSSPFTGSTNPNVKISYVSTEKKANVSLDKDALHAQFNFMLGRLKTVLDATVSNPVQNKALKDLVSQEVWHRYNYILEITGMVGSIISDGITEIS